MGTLQQALLKSEHVGSEDVTRVERQVRIEKEQHRKQAVRKQKQKVAARRKKLIQICSEALVDRRLISTAADAKLLGQDFVDLLTDEQLAALSDFEVSTAAQMWIALKLIS